MSNTLEQIICEVSHGQTSLESTKYLIYEVVKLRAELKIALMSPAQLSEYTVGLRNTEVSSPLGRAGGR